MASIEVILDKCLSHNSEERQPAERALQNAIESNPSEALKALLGCFQHKRQDLQQLSCVYVRRTFKTQPQLFRSLPESLQNEFKNYLLSALVNSNVGLNIRRKICDIIEVLAIQLTLKGWPSALESVAALSSGNHGEEVIICSVYLLGLITQSCFNSINKQSLKMIVNQTWNLLKHQSMEVRLSALKAFERILSTIEDENPTPNSPPDPTPLFFLLKEALQISKEKAHQILESLTEIAKSHSELFINHLTDIQTMMSQLANNSELNGDTRSLALELIVTLVEAEPQIIRKNKQMIEKSLDIALNFMLQLEHDADWSTTTSTSAEDEFDFVNDALTRLAEAIGAPKFAGPCMQRIEELLQRKEWKFKFAGLCTLAQVMEVFKKKKMPARTLMKKIVPFLQDDHPRVRYQSVACLALMCTDFGQKFCSKNSKVILESIFKLLADNQNPRMNVHGTNCIVNFCEKASMRCLKKWLKSILENLFELAKRTQVEVVHFGMLNALAEVADSSRKQFKEYYGPITNLYVMKILRSNCKNELKVEAFRCLSFFARAVGFNLFKDHAQEALQISITQTDADILLLLRCWGRIAETLEENFQPYLNLVLPQALKYAAQDCIVKNYDSDDEDNNVEVVLQNEKQIALNSNSLQEKEGGLEFLGVLASACPKSFQPFLQNGENIKIITQNIEYKLNSSIRSAALEALKGIAECAIINYEKHPQASQELFVNSLELLCSRLKEEEKTNVLSEVAHCISKLISHNQEFTKHVLTPNMCAQVVRSLIKCVSEMNERINLRNVAMLAPDLDPEDAEDFNEENKRESSVSRETTDALDALLKIYKDDLLELFTKEVIIDSKPTRMMDQFEWMISDDAHPIQRYTVLRIFCYIFESCSQSSTSDYIGLSTRFIECMDDDSCDVCQAATYALGLIAEQANSSVFAPHVNKVLEKCFEHFEKQSDESAYDSVLDNDTSTIGKILKYHANCVSNKQEIYLRWLTRCFPMREDVQEAEWCYNRFCELLEEQNADFLGANMCNLGVIVKAMVDGYGSQFMSEKAEAYYKNFVTKLQTNSDNNIQRLLDNTTF